MLKKLIISGYVVLAMTIPQHSAAQDNSCEVQVAVASPPVPRDNSVAFNISNEQGVNKSFILDAGNQPKTITNLSCLPSPYLISASLFAQTPNQLNNQPIGQCTLKAGYILLKSSNSSASVVFPYDFNCQ